MQSKGRIFLLVLSMVLLFVLLPTVALAADENNDGYDDHDFNKLQSFLNKPSGVSGKTNGQQLNPNYDENDPRTWNGVHWNDSNPKRVTMIDISWSGKRLVGKLDLNGLSRLHTLICSNNQLTSLDVRGTSLLLLNCDNNRLTRINATIAGKNIQLTSNTNGYVELSYYTLVLLAKADPHSGASFVNWTGSSTSRSNPYALALGKSYDLVANFSTATVKFDSQGGSKVDDMIVNVNSTFTAPADPTRKGFTFEGWFREPECENEWNFETDKVTSNMTLYAKWDILQCTVTFDSQGGSAVSPVTTDYGTTISAPTAPTRTGHTFGGWYKEAACENAWDFDSDTVTEDITLFAKWNINYYTVKFVDWDGTVLNEQEVPYGSSATAPADPSRTGHTFTGWDVAFDNITGDLTVTAQYTINRYTVRFDSQGGSDVPSVTADYNTTITAPAAPTREGHTFEGWYKEAACINAWNFSSDKVAGDTVLYAKWKLIPITGLPDKYTMYVGGRVTFEPAPSGGTWEWDEDYFNASLNGKATFTALKSGVTTITYSVYGQSHNIIVTVKDTVLPETGQNYMTAIWLALLAVCTGGAAVVLAVRRCTAQRHM